jgi:hypothetical protein
MSNMSYCRFRNTLSDLEDCCEYIDSKNLTWEEDIARESLIELCTQIANEFKNENID